MQLIRTVVAGLLLFAAACGDNDPNDPGTGGGTFVNGTFTNTLSGGTFNPLSVVVTNSTFSGTQTIFSLAAADASGRSFAFAVVISGTGTYPMQQTNGNNAIYIEGGMSWTAAFGLAGSSGSATFTSVTANRIAGSFNFTLVAQGGSASGTRTISGNFDLDPSY